MLLLLLLIHVCGSKYTRSAVHTTWSGGRYLSGPWGYLLGPQGVVNEAQYHTERSTHYVMWWVLPLEYMSVPIGSTNRILPGTQMVYGAKYHTEWSTHHVIWWALPLRSVGVPLGSITSRPWFSYSHVLMFPCSPNTRTELNPIYNINYSNNNNVRSICYSVLPCSNESRPAYWNSDVFCWKCGLQCEPPVVWNTNGDDFE